MNQHVSEELKLLVKAHERLVAAVTAQEALPSAPPPAVERPAEPRKSEAVSVPKAAKPRPPRRGNVKDLDRKVFELLASRPGTSIAELERELSGVSRSLLEWSLRRLSADGLIEKTGKTCGARYSTKMVTAPLSLPERAEF